MTEIIVLPNSRLITNSSNKNNNLPLQSQNNKIDNFSKDLINKIYKTCGCILISELDIINNTINEKYIQICPKHYQKTESILHIVNNKSVLSQIDLKKNIIINDSYLNFGKYKNKTFHYVFQTDKLYCYNLAFWKNNTINMNTYQNTKKININEFIIYIKNQININEE